MYRAYVLTLLLPMILFGLYGATLGSWLDPLIGDLTRMGGYAENQFGWNGREAVFFPPLAQPGNLKVSTDIVVIGDSFSSHTSPDRQTPEGGYWVDFLAAGTGRSVSVFNMDKVGIDAFVDSPAYREAPPQWLIYEIVERELLSAVDPGACATLASSPVRSPLPARYLTPAPTARQPRLLSRDDEVYNDTGLFGRAVHFSYKYAMRQLRSANDRVGHHHLTRADLFTSNQSTEFIAWSSDSASARWRPADWQAIGCTLQRMQQRVEANGRTRMLVMVVPTKISAYSAYLDDMQEPMVPAQEHLGDLGLNMIAVDRPLRQAIDQGTLDVYLPNDTHWSTTGSRIAAQTAIEHLGGQPMAVATLP